jgi:branched-chain amino acid transport system substrate-binding protein
MKPNRFANRCLVALAAFGVLAFSAFAAGCGGGESSDGGGGGSDEGPIKIGAVLPLTGPAAFFGPLQRDGLKLRLSEANGEVDGRPVELTILDGGATLESTQTAARRLIEEEGVSMIVGPLQSDMMAGITPYYEQQNIPAIALLNLPPELGGKVFTPQGDLQSGSAPVGLYAAEELGVKTASTVVSDYIAGEDVANGFAEGFEAGGGSVVQTQQVPLSSTDYAPYLSNLQTADALAPWVLGATQNFLEEYIKRGAFEQVLIGYGDALTEEQLEAFGSKAEGWLAPLTYTWRIDTPESKKFAAAVRDSYGRNPVAQIDEGAYEAMSVALEAIQATGGDTDPDTIKKAILGLELETPAGPVRFNEEGFGVRNVYILEVAKVDGEMAWKPIHTYENVGEEG